MNTVVQIADCCRACLRIESNLTPATAVDVDNIKLSDKLFCCVSEVIWLKEGSPALICSSCLDKLRIAYDFKILCLQSDSTLQQCFFEQKDIERPTEFVSEGEVDSNGLITISQQPQTQQANTEFFNLKQFLDNEIVIRPATQADINLSRSVTPDSVISTGLANTVKTPKKVVNTTRSIKTQTQPLPQYPTLTPAAARLEAQQLKTTIIVDDPYKYTCEVCGKRYAKNANLKIHMRTHTGEKPFECKYCDKKFYHSSHLREHIRRHTGEKPFQCTVCSKRFTITAELTVHMRIHTGEKPYACNCCDKRYIKASDLQVHMRTHTGEKPFSCTYCEKKFASGYILNSHVKIHTGERPWACKFCSKAFTQSSHLTIHMKKHTAESEEEKL